MERVSTVLYSTNTSVKTVDIDLNNIDLKLTQFGRGEMGILHNFAFQLNLLTFGSKGSWKSFVGHTKLFYENLGEKHRVQQII